jgi:predicted O-methyltransferase YrrM
MVVDSAVYHTCRHYNGFVGIWPGSHGMNRNRAIKALLPLVDLVLFVFVIPAALLLWMVRRLGLARLRLTRAVLIRIGLLPVRNHYYEPFVVPRELRYPLDQERKLPGIDLNVAGQLEFLSTLTFEKELAHLATPGSRPGEYSFGNASFESGDAEYLYQVIRRIKPSRVYEIGSGYSTLMVRAALKRNAEELPGYGCRHLCIEPFEAQWLESTGVEVMRQRVEDVDQALFQELGRGDLLFIDSSHMIRPQGDVVTEYLEILPILRSGVIVHIHDVFTPRDYLEEWVVRSLRLWNEQYLMEAFLTDNDNWAIIGALNWLKHSHFDDLKRVCPYLTIEREPGSLYMRRK